MAQRTTKRRRVKCPLCKQQGKPISDGTYQCQNGHVFDDDPNEGGDVFTDPTKRLRREESRFYQRQELRGGLGS